MNQDILKFIEDVNVEKRILITNDKDFGELTFMQKKLSSGIILLRIKRQRTDDKVKILKKVFQNYKDKILNNFVTITDKKIRFIPMEDIND